MTWSLGLPVASAGGGSGRIQNRAFTFCAFTPNTKGSGELNTSAPRMLGGNGISWRASAFDRKDGRFHRRRSTIHRIDRDGFIAPGPICVLFAEAQVFDLEHPFVGSQVSNRTRGGRREDRRVVRLRRIVLPSRKLALETFDPFGALLPSRQPSSRYF